MPMKTPKPFLIFRAGTHTDSAGNKTTFTREELASAVQAYGEGDWRAPLVCGHPKGDAPAYGWVGKMRVDEEGGVWVDQVDELNQDFAELMEKKAFRNRSASWYHPDHPSNPTPGVWGLRHLGMLGAMPPALKGLKDVEFHDSEGITVEFEDYALTAIGRVFRNMREFFIEKFGMDVTDKVIPNWTVADLDEMGRRRAEPENTPPLPDVAFTETEDAPTMDLTPAQIADLQQKAARADALEAENGSLKTANTDLQAKVTNFAEQERVTAAANALTQAKADLAPLVTAGKILPAQVDYHAQMLVGQDNQAKVFEFGEFTGEKAMTARAAYLHNLGQSQKVVEYSEVTSSAAMPADLSPQQLADKITEYQDSQAAKGVHVTGAQALEFVTANHK